jgi:adenosine deaminase
MSQADMIGFMRNAFESAWIPDDQRAGYLEELERFAVG